MPLNIYIWKCEGQRINNLRWLSQVQITLVLKTRSLIELYLAKWEKQEVLGASKIRLCLPAKYWNYKYKNSDFICFTSVTGIKLNFFQLRDEHFANQARAQNLVSDLRKSNHLKYFLGWFFLYYSVSYGRTLEFSK